jgi:hypothetical protein
MTGCRREVNSNFQYRFWNVLTIPLGVCDVTALSSRFRGADDKIKLDAGSVVSVDDCSS